MTDFWVVFSELTQIFKCEIKIYCNKRCDNYYLGGKHKN